MSKVAIIDYGSSNLRSVAKALEFVADGRHEITVSSDPKTILDAARVVFPGQGAIGDCMRSLHDCALVDVVQRALRERPFLGICLGLQSLMSTSDEDGGTACLGRYAGTVRHFRTDAGPAADGSPRKIPHMGWNEVHWRKAHPLIDGIADGTRFYFVHSYYVVPDDAAVIMGQTDYIDRFVSAVASGNAFATQFHPEKSAAAGLRLLKNFLAWNGAV
jgi:glutamine amidotransferase